MAYLVLAGVLCLALSYPELLLELFRIDVA